MSGLVGVGRNGTMKILFLDVDGVLNDYEVCKKATWEDDRTFFAKKYVDRVNRILEATDAMLVISSSWRIRYDTIDDLKLAFRKFGFDMDRVIDKTPSRYEGHRFSEDTIRGLEIQRWLSENAEKYDVESIVILDDDQDMFHLNHRLVRTVGFQVDKDGGISEEQVAKAIEILNTPDDTHTRFNWKKFVNGNRQKYLNELEKERTK